MKKNLQILTEKDEGKLASFKHRREKTDCIILYVGKNNNIVVGIPGLSRTYSILQKDIIILGKKVL